MNYYIQRAGKIIEQLDELAQCSDDSSCISRIFGTPAFVAAQQKIKSWMEDAGLTTHVDNIGNVRGRINSSDSAAKTFVIASHFDSVINAGKFDGPLGVMMAIDLLENLIASSEPLQFNIEVIAFSDEEGVRFHSTFLGSRVITGGFDKRLLEVEDSTGNNLKDVLLQLNLDPDKISGDAIALDEWLGYFEIHIEQGPVLYNSGDPVAVVTGIAGQKRIMVTLAGMAGHAGTVPMHMRKDALACAAEIILAIENYGLEHKDEIVATVGKIDVEHAATNVIPGAVKFSVDVRSADGDILQQAFDNIRSLAEAVAEKRKISLEWKLVQETAPVICDQNLAEVLITSMTSAGYKPVRLVSGAGHDAVPVSDVAPVAMLFVRCYEGISHNPLENAEIKDIAAGIQVSENFLQLLIQKFNRS